MPENEDSRSGALAELTPEELKILSLALRRIEADLFQKVLKRISVLLGIVLSILLVSGVVNLSSCSSNIETTMSQKLANDPELRDKIVSKAQGDFKDTEEKLKKLNDQIAELEKENARAVSSSVTDLKQISFMIDRVNDELSRRLQPNTNKEPSSGKEKQ